MAAECSFRAETKKIRHISRRGEKLGELHGAVKSNTTNLISSGK